MNTLKKYLSLLSPEEQAEFARRAGTTIGYLRKALCIGQRFGGVLARRLDEASSGAVPRHVLRPDIFDTHFPLPPTPQPPHATQAKAKAKAKAVKPRVTEKELTHEQCL